VLFVESLGLRRPQLAARDLNRMARRLQFGFAPPRPTDELHVISPLVIPYHGLRAARELNARLLPGVVRRAMERLGMRSPVLWSYVPQAEVLLDVVAPSLVVYHCVDDLAAQKGIDAKSFSASERRFARRSDLILASAPGLVERLRMISRDVVHAPNVADTALFAEATGPGHIDSAMAALPRPRIAFTGAVVATKLDFDLLVELARLRRDWSLALVGPIGPGDPRTDVSALAQEPNLHLLGARPYGALPSVLRGADAGLIPYAVNELTRSVFPMKVYEYLAAGLPVVATPLPAIAQVPDVVIAADAVSMARELDRLLAEDTADLRAARSRRAAAHSWEARLTEIDAELSRL
jgi:glycosyltransferase involved in cell wall biosynthesis